MEDGDRLGVSGYTSLFNLKFPLPRAWAPSRARLAGGPGRLPSQVQVAATGSELRSRISTTRASHGASAATGSVAAAEPEPDPEARPG